MKRNQNLKKNFFCKLTLFFIVLFFLQIIFANYFFEIQLGEQKKHTFKFDMFFKLKNYLKDKTDIIYFGDSVIHAIGENDTDVRSIIEILRDITSGTKIAGINYFAYHSGIFYEYCRYIVQNQKEKSLSTVIIPINMRSFSPEWDKRPQYQHEKEMIILRGGLNKILFLTFYQPLRVFNYNYTTITHKEFLKAPVFNGLQQVGIVKEFNDLSSENISKIKMKKKIIFHYMYLLARQHRKLKALIDTAILLKNSGINPLFYITPIDWQIGETYLPGKFLKRLKQNTNMIISYLSKTGASVLDLSTALSTNSFSWEIYPNEHLNQNGRTYVAQRIKHKLAQ